MSCKRRSPPLNCATVYIKVLEEDGVRKSKSIALDTHYAKD